MMSSSNKRSASSRQDFSRSDRIRKAMIREMGNLLTTDLQDPELEGVLMSVTDAEVSGDLQHVKLFISVMAEPAVQARVLEKLKAQLPRLRSVMGQRIVLRHTPQLHLILDDGLARGSRMTTLLNELALERHQQDL
ncbi:MAG: 30S ribosome-binding factor RbfA [Vampirovibrionales bacterium]|nr:30S ribosome-binding factor RbfA [Vampirovibrionales bacterium]